MCCVTLDANQQQSLLRNLYALLLRNSGEGCGGWWFVHVMAAGGHAPRPCPGAGGGHLERLEGGREVGHTWRMEVLLLASDGSGVTLNPTLMTQNPTSYLDDTKPCALRPTPPTATTHCYHHSFCLVWTHCSSVDPPCLPPCCCPGEMRVK